jgi:tRNA(fMet)-specific endonuclease VapC
MSSRYLLDTNIVSFIIKGNMPAISRRLVRVPINELFISSITEGELRYGVARRPAATKLQQLVEEFLLRITVLPWDSDATRHYGVLRADFENLGQSLGYLDTLIGAHALSLGATLVTNDRAFSRIKKLRIEDWTMSHAGQRMM